MGLLDKATSETDDVGFTKATSIGNGKAVRVIDEEAGVVLYGMKVQKGDGTAKGGGYGLTAVPLEDTNLE